MLSWQSRECFSSAVSCAGWNTTAGKKQVWFTEIKKQKQMVYLHLRGAHCNFTQKQDYCESSMVSRWIKRFFSPFHFNFKTAMQFAVNTADTKPGAFPKVKFLSPNLKLILTSFATFNMPLKDFNLESLSEGKYPFCSSAAGKSKRPSLLRRPWISEHNLSSADLLHKGLKGNAVHTRRDDRQRSEPRPWFSCH